MREGELYPELRYANIAPTKITRSQSSWPVYPKTINEVVNNMVVEKTVIDAVQVTMPREDWEMIMEIYRAHYHAANHNPGVLDRWMEYRMMVALTER